MYYICYKGDNITMVKTAVLVSGGGSNLQALLDAKLFGELKNCELAAVISSAPDVYALKRAEYAGIPSYVVDLSLIHILPPVLLRADKTVFAVTNKVPPPGGAQRLLNKFPLFRAFPL